MPFHSQYQHLIWESLYIVGVPDQLTMNPDYIKKFGVATTGDKNIDKMLSTNYTTVMIPISKILEYFVNGIEVQIYKREDMIQIHKDIELYLQEWREHLRYDINLHVSDYQKNLILSIEKLSKHIYNKASPREVIDNLFLEKKIGLVNPLKQAEAVKAELVKPDYTGLSNLVKKRVTGRFS